VILDMASQEMKHYDDESALRGLGSEEIQEEREANLIIQIQLC
jgi:hypothetical protein